MDDDVFFMKCALDEAKRARDLGEVPIGAVAVYDQQIIGKGFNCPISFVDPTAHAEIIAIRQAAQYLKNYRLIDVTLYVTLEPCLMCIGAITHSRIKRLVFGAPDTNSMKKLNHKFEYYGNVLFLECKKIIDDFFYDKR